jgi:hypothetical protein
VSSIIGTTSPIVISDGISSAHYNFLDGHLGNYIHGEGWRFSLQTRWRMLSPPLRRSGRRTNVDTGTPPLLVATVALASPLVTTEPSAPVMAMYGSRLTSLQPNNRSNEISPLANPGLLCRSRRLTTIVPSYALASPALTIGTLQLPCGL